MKKTLPHRSSTSLLMLMIVLSLVTGKTLAQGFIKSYQIPYLQSSFTALLDCSDGNFCLTTLTPLNNNDTSQIAVQLFADADGEQSGLNQHTVFWRNYRSIIALGCGDFLGLDTLRNDAMSISTIAERFTAGGTTIWRDTLPQAYPGADNEIGAATYTTDGNLLLLKGGDNFFVQKMDPNGTLLFTKTLSQPFSGSLFNHIGSLIPSPDGGVLFRWGATINGLVTTALVKLTPSGDVEWVVSPTGLGFNSASYAPDGHFYAQHSGITAPAFSAVSKNSSAGALIWEVDLRDVLQDPSFIAHKSTATNDNGVLVAGSNYTVAGAVMLHNMLARFDSSGTLLWKKEFFGNSPIAFTDVKAMADGNFALTGSQNGFLTLLKVDGTGALLPNAMEGTLVRDEDSDCAFDATEPPLAGWIVRALANGTEYFSVTDENGHFVISDLPGGPSYTIDLAAQPPSYLWLPCAMPLLTMPADTTQFTLQANAAVDILAYCPVMTVDIGVPVLRRCANRTLYANYCNAGTIIAENAALEVYLPDEIEMQGSPQAYTQTGQTIRFELGNVAPGACGNVALNVYISCDSTQIGQTLCLEAHVFPDSFCLLSQGWSGASIETEADCLGDTALLSIRNAGNAETTEPLQYFIIDDDVVMLQGTIPMGFAPGSTKNLLVEATGSTFRISSEQEPNHPVTGNPSVAIEGCNGWSLGFITPFSNQRGDPFSDRECRVIVGPFDPNEKKAYPEGIHGQHFIAPKTPLTYVLHFQNTGTDTAFRVVLRDTLSQWLDPMTLRPGASSHPYHWTVKDQGQLVFTFDPIALPDSNANVMASQGFVQFDIQMRSDVPLGTVIENHAGIYFDQNAVVLTNTVFHQVDTGFLVIHLVSTSEPHAFSTLSIYPNPATEAVTIALKDDFDGIKSLVLEDAYGKTVIQAIFSGGKITVRQADLPTGIYFVKIIENERIVATGRVMWH